MKKILIRIIVVIIAIGMLIVILLNILKNSDVIKSNIWNNDKPNIETTTSNNVDMSKLTSEEAIGIYYKSEVVDASETISTKGFQINIKNKYTTDKKGDFDINTSIDPKIFDSEGNLINGYKYYIVDVSVKKIADEEELFDLGSMWLGIFDEKNEIIREHEIYSCTNSSSEGKRFFIQEMEVGDEYNGSIVFLVTDEELNNSVFQAMCINMTGTTQVSEDNRCLILK